MVWRFLKHYGMSKANDVLEEFASTVVAFDPESASNAQIAMMEAELHKLGGRLAEAEEEVRREHRETADLRQAYNDYLEAAHILEARMNDCEDPHEHKEIESSLSRTIAKLENLKPEIEREEEEDREVEAWRVELRRSFEELGQKLRHSKSELTSAKRRMDMARMRRERAQEQDRRAREAVGITSSISSLSVALDSMNQQTAKLRAESETLKLKAGLFQAQQMETDPHIAAALDAARGKQAQGKQSLSERLAALEDSGERPRLTIAS